LSQIEQSIQQQEKQRQEEEIKAKCDKIEAEADKLLENENWINAKSKYEEALKLCPQEKSIQNKIEQCAKKIKDKEDKFNELLLEATVAEKKGKLKEALSMLEEAQKIKLDNSELKKRIKNIHFNLDFETEKKPAPQKTKVEKGVAFLSKPTKNSSEEDDFWGVSKNKKVNVETKKIDDDFLGIGNQKTSEIKGDNFLNVTKKKDKSLDF
jgi:tetratricopeptide (TPR) repeat protein